MQAEDGARELLGIPSPPIPEPRVLADSCPPCLVFRGQSRGSFNNLSIFCEPSEIDSSAPGHRAGWKGEVPSVTGLQVLANLSLTDVGTTGGSADLLKEHSRKPRLFFSKLGFLNLTHDAEIYKLQQ